MTEPLNELRWISPQAISSISASGLRFSKQVQERNAEFQPYPIPPQPEPTVICRDPG